MRCARNLLSGGLTSPHAGSEPRPRAPLALAATASTFAFTVSLATAQCWLPTIGTPGLNATARAATAWDPDGAGPAAAQLVVGGSFTSAGGATANRIARWDGSAWTPLGAGFNGSVFALAATPNGDLIAAGSFTTPATRIARWNGTAWSPLGAGVDDLVNALAVMPNGDVIAGGRFTSAGGVPVNRVARWDGAAWSPLGAGGGGVGGSPPFYVVSLAAKPNGNLVVGGFFSTAGGSPAKNVAEWNGSAWTLLGVGIEGVVDAIIALPNNDVIVGGQFNLLGNFTPGYNRVARWNGAAWSPLGTGLEGPVGTTIVWSLARIPQTGEIIAGGDFDLAGGVPASNVARWDGAAWAPIGAGTDDVVFALAALPDASVAVAGQFLSAGGNPQSRVALVSNGGGSLEIAQQPQAVTICPADEQTASFSVAAAGSINYQWQIEEPAASDTWLALSDGNLSLNGFSAAITGAATGQLSLDMIAQSAAERRFRSVLSGTCGAAATSDAASLFLCRADFNCDGDVTSQDFFDFLAAFFTGNADFNNDGDTTSQDFFDFIAAFFTGCP